MIRKGLFSIMNLSAVQSLSKHDMDAVNALINKQLSSDVVLINQLGFYIINSGGKRLRPLLAVLAARALGYKGDKHHTLAAIVEFIHTATLLHDRSEEHTSELQSRPHLVCRLLLEKKKIINTQKSDL